MDMDEKNVTLRSEVPICCREAFSGKMKDLFLCQKSI